jgi:RimJ/RimL family protein N-acetyltransferase
MAVEGERQPMASTIGTDRLDLRPLVVEDADQMVTVLADPELHRFTGGRPATLDELRRQYAGWVAGSGNDREQWLNWIVRLGAGGPAVGTVQATVVTAAELLPSTTAYVAWVIGTAWQSRGYAGEAARALVRHLLDAGVDDVVAHVNAEHVASAAVAARAGLRPTDQIADGEVVWRLGADSERTVT